MKPTSELQAQDLAAVMPVPPAIPTGRPARRERGGALARHHLLPLALYLAIAVVMTFPLVLHLGTHLPGNHGDAWKNYWDIWWMRTALLGGQNPLRSPLLYMPYGAPLYLDTYAPFNGLVSIPIQLAFGVTVAYNAVALLSLTLAAYFAYLLVAYVSGSRAAGFAGGVIYGFGSYHLAHLQGQLNLVASEWLPAYVLCLVAAGATAGRRRLLWGGGAVVALALTMLCDWQYVLFAVLFTALYALYGAITRRSLAPLLVVAAIGAGWLVVAAPLLAPTVAEARRPDRLPVGGPELFSADLLSFIRPSPYQSLWGPAADRLGGSVLAPAIERAIFLGYLPLALAAYGLWRDRRRGRFWALAALAFAVLALGPALQVGGETRFGPAKWAVPLPFALLHRVPFAGEARVPARFGVVVTLCLAVLAGLGLAATREALGRRLAPRTGPRGRAALLALLLVALLLEHFPAPYPLQRVDAPAFYRLLGRSAEPGTILELPLNIERSQSLFYQTAHRRPLVGGYLARPFDYPLLKLPLFEGVLDEAQRDYRGDVKQPLRSDIVPAPGPEVGAWGLAFAGVRWIVVLRDEARQLDPAALAAFLGRYAEPDPLYQDERTVVYRPKPPGAPLPYLQVADGWHDRETLAGRQDRMRWFGWSAAFDAWSFGDGPQRAVLRFDAWSFAQPRRLEVAVDGRAVGQWLVADPRRLAIPLTLAPGDHRIELRALDAPARPVDLGAGSDARLLSIGVANVELVRDAAAAEESAR